ncbi:MAG: nucleotidyl transferase AbiEii/AbiGii toxin family protein [Opitutae bacterium]|nr:nucleotidyl transferase AbiEii/AbiGii toxin family protein [Opitutae bacterium]
MKESVFYPQADLLVQTLPFVHAEECFALKGGTAINFFVRDFPRLSVDIDLVYLPVEERAVTLRGIDAALRRIAEKIRRALPNVQVREQKPSGENLVVKLTLRGPRGADVKVEPNSERPAARYGAAERSEFGFEFDYYREPAGRSGKLEILYLSRIPCSREKFS